MTHFGKNVMMTIPETGDWLAFCTVVLIIWARLDRREHGDSSAPG